MAKRSAAPKDNTATLVLGLLAVGGIGYLLLKPSEAAAAPAGATQKCWDGSIISASSACPPSQVCFDGSIIAASATCPAKPAPPPAITTQTCPDGLVIPAGLPCPTTPVVTPPAPPAGFNAAPSITPILAGDGPTGFQSLGIPNLPAVMTSDPNGDPKYKVNPQDYLVFVQGYIPGLPMTLAFPDPGPTPIAAILRDADNGGPGGAATSAKSLAQITKPGGPLNEYYGAPFLDALTKPGEAVLIWTTDSAGVAVSWWITSWGK